MKTIEEIPASFFLGRLIVHFAWMFLAPFAIKWLWKIVLIPIFSISPISYWQAFGLQWFVVLIVYIALANIEYKLELIQKLLK
jgi:hypothetical protein